MVSELKHYVKTKELVLLLMNRTEEDWHQLVVNMNTNLLAGDGEMLVV